MGKKTHLMRLAEFDVTQKIIEALCNVSARAILFSVRDTAKDAGQISQELNLSQSTVYTSLAHLEDLALVAAERFVLENGKKQKMFRSRISRVEIQLTNTEPVLRLYPNTEEERSVKPWKNSP